MQWRPYNPFKETEITPYTDKPWTASLMFLLNNFFCNFEYSINSFNSYRSGRITNKDVTIKKFPKLVGRDGGEEPVRVTYEEFYKDLDLTVMECGFKIEDVGKAISCWKEDKADKNAEIVFKILAPIYKGMRCKGYTRDDLWT